MPHSQPGKLVLTVPWELAKADDRWPMASPMERSLLRLTHRTAASPEEKSRSCQSREGIASSASYWLSHHRTSPDERNREIAHGVSEKENVAMFNLSLQILRPDIKWGQRKAESFFNLKTKQCWTQRFSVCGPQASSFTQKLRNTNSQVPPQTVWRRKSVLH